MALFILTQSHTSSFFFGMIITGETHGVGSSTFSMIPCYSKCSSSFSTFFKSEMEYDEHLEQQDLPVCQCGA